MNKSTLVTALYHHSPYEIIGGRGWDFPYFAAPFLNVLKLNQPMVIYTHEKMTDHLIPFLEQHATSPYEVVNYDLYNFKYSEKVLSLKRASGKFIKDTLKEEVSYIDNDRNTHLCLNKLYWLKEESDLNRFSTNDFYWIDAGLFHHGIFPEKYGGRERLSRQENNPSLYYPDHKLSIFQPKLVESFSRMCEKFICLIHEEMPINELMRNLLNVDGKTIGYIVGGFFGGFKNYIDIVHEKFDTSLKTVLDEGMLTLEEDLLSCVGGLTAESFQPIRFNNWHHDIKGEPCYYGAGEEAKSFYKIFKHSASE